MSQPNNGISKKPLVFAQITNGVSSPERSHAKIVSSSRVIDIKSNMFLHLFYNKPYLKNMGYNHTVDSDCRLRIKAKPCIFKTKDILAARDGDCGNAKTNPVSELEFLTLSEVETWGFKPEVRVAEFFAKSFGVPIDCWTVCSKMQIFRELCQADRIMYELQGSGCTSECALTAGELAKSLHDGDRDSFDPYEDLTGDVELSILFVNENPEIQTLDFRCRMRILPSECETRIAYSYDNHHRFVTRDLDGTYTIQVDNNGNQKVLNFRNVDIAGLKQIDMRYNQLDLGFDMCLLPVLVRNSKIWIDRRGNHLPLYFIDAHGNERFVEPIIEVLRKDGSFNMVFEQSTEWGESRQSALDYWGSEEKCGKERAPTFEGGDGKGKGDEGKGDKGKGDKGKGDEGKGDEGKGDEGKGDEGKGDEGKDDEMTREEILALLTKCIADLEEMKKHQDHHGKDECKGDKCGHDVVCGEALTCVGGLKYPTTCGPANGDKPIGECQEEKTPEEIEAERLAQEAQRAEEERLKKEAETARQAEAAAAFEVTDITDKSFVVTSFLDNAELRLFGFNASGLPSLMYRDSNGDGQLNDPVIRTVSAISYNSLEEPFNAPELQPDTTYRVQIKDTTDDSSIHYIDFTTAWNRFQVGDVVSFDLLGDGVMVYELITEINDDTKEYTIMYRGSPQIKQNEEVELWEPAFDVGDNVIVNTVSIGANDGVVREIDTS